MPSRIIKESIRTSETLVNVSSEAERLFWRLVVTADDFGRFEARPNIVLGQCLSAFVGKVTEEQVSVWLQELDDAGLIKRYTVDGKRYLLLTSWYNHQQKRAKKSKYPQPHASDITCKQLITNVPDNENENENVFENVIVNVNGNGNENESEIEVVATVERDSSSSLGSSLSRLSRIYDNERFGQPTLVVTQTLEIWIEEFGVEWSELAMKEAIKRNRRSLKYVESILQNWRAEGGPNTSDHPRASPRRTSEVTRDTKKPWDVDRSDERYTAFYDAVTDT